MARNIVRLNENQIKEFIKEAVRKVVNEIGDTPQWNALIEKESDDRLGWANDTWFIFADLKETLGCEKLCHEIAGKLDEKTLQMILKRIVAEYDIYNYNEEEDNNWIDEN